MWFRRSSLILIAILSIIAFSSCSAFTSTTTENIQEQIADQAMLKYYQEGPIVTYSWLQTKVDDGSISDADYDGIINQLNKQ